jgi:hypothetical protein
MKPTIRELIEERLMLIDPRYAQQTFNKGYNKALSDYEEWLKSEEAQFIVERAIVEYREKGNPENTVNLEAKAILTALTTEREG